MLKANCADLVSRGVLNETDYSAVLDLQKEINRNNEEWLKTQGNLNNIMEDYNTSKRKSEEYERRLESRRAELAQKHKKFVDRAASNAEKAIEVSFHIFYVFDRLYVLILLRI